MKFSCRFLIPLLVAGTSLLGADLTITFNTKGKGLFKAAGGVQVEHYTEAFQLTRDTTTKQDTLVDYAKGVTYTIDHKKRTIGMFKLEDAMAAMDSLGSAQPEGMASVMGALFGDPNDVSVDRDGTEVVADRLCHRYKIRVAKLNAELFADPKLKMPVPDAVWAKHYKASAARMAAAGPAAAAFRRLYEEMSKIKGVVLKSTIGGGMVPTVERVATEVSMAPVDPASFKLPEGYPIEDLGKKMREEMAKARK